MKSQANRIFFLFLAFFVFFIYENMSANLSFSYLILSLSFLISNYSILRKCRVEGVPYIANGNLWVSVGILLMFLIAPVANYFFSESLPIVFARRDWQTAYPQVNLLVSMSILSLCAGDCRTISVGFLRLPNQNFGVYKRTVPVALIAIICWLTYYFVWAKSQGGFFSTVFATRAQFGAAGASSTNGYGFDAIYGALGALSVLIVISFSSHKALHRILIVLYFLLLLPSIFNGSRSKFVFYLVVLLIIKVSLGSRVTKRQVFIILLIVPLIIVAPRLYRGDSTGLSSRALTEAYDVKNVINTLTQEDLAMGPALSILELQRESGRIPYLYGSSYIGAILKPIPRKLFQSKPIEFDKRLNSIIFPVESKNVGLSFSAISEPLVNFGGIGVIFFFYLLGMGNQKFISMRNQGDLNGVLIHAWLTGFMFVLIRGNLTTDYQRALFPLGTALIIIKISPLARLNSKSN